MNTKSILDLIARPLADGETQARYIYQRHVKGAVIESEPIFIVGCGHSGTSLLLKILGAHSRIHAIHYETKVAFKSPEEQKIYLHLFDKWTLAGRKKRWVEKTPRHIRSIDKLLELCPQAYVILIIRDGRDVACSLKARFGDFEKGIHRWVNDNNKAQPYLSKKNVMLIKYEDLIEDFEQSVSGVLRLVGEEYEPAMQEYFKIPMRFQWRGHASTWLSTLITSAGSKEHRQRRIKQIHQPIFDGRGKWRNEMSEEEKELFKQLAGDMLIKFGYEKSDTW